MNGSDLKSVAGFALALTILFSPAEVAARQRHPAPGTDQTVTVSATGRVTRDPDRALVTVAIENSAATAEAAAEANAARMTRLLGALRRLGLGEDAIETTSYQLIPEYDYSQESPRRPPEQRIIGYRAVNMVRVTIDEIGRVGEVIDAAISAGANRVHGVNFTLRDPAEARRDALRQAMEEARKEAETIADALGLRLGPVRAVTTAGGFDRPVYAFQADVAAARAVPTPIEPGTLDITASVTVVFLLEPRQ